MGLLLDLRPRMHFDLSCSLLWFGFKAFWLAIGCAVKGGDLDACSSVADLLKGTVVRELRELESKISVTE